MKKAVDEVKEKWIGRVIGEAECVIKDGKQRWMSLQELQQDHAGRRPTRPTRMYKKDGEMTNCQKR